MEAEDHVMIASMKNFLTELRDYIVSPSYDDYHLRSTVVGNYSVTLEEVENEVVNWSLQYLEQRKCPSVLTLAISKCVAEQLKQFVENGNKFGESEQNIESDASIDAVHLQTETIRHLHDLCDHWRENPDQLLKHTAGIKDDPYFTSVCTIKNIRRKMEDRYTVIHNLNLVCGLENAPHHSYYGVFDGHAGTRAANYAAAHLHSNIAHHPAFLSDPEVAIKEGFKVTDNQILERSKKENTKSGCTVVCSFLNETTLHVAWVGDSQAILVRQGIPYIITNPHKPDRQNERQRIEGLNGYVLFIGTWRVNGTLAVSRALGDPDHKPYVSAEPDVISIPLEGNEDFFVLACDGLWDRLNPSDVASAIYSYLVEHPPNDYDEVASRLVMQAKEHGSGDNITAIVVFLKDPKELAANPKNPPPYSLQLNGSKVDSWCQGSWNGTHENDSTSAQYAYPYPETLRECAIKPNSLGELPKPDDVVGVHQINYKFNPVTCEAGSIYENDEGKNVCHSGMNSIMPEATAFSELPTPPIDELLACQQFGEQEKLIEMSDTLSIVSDAAEIKQSSVTLVDSGILEQDSVHAKQSDFASHDIQVISHNDDNDELLSADTAVEMASEIVNNAIELAVNQVMVRTSSQMSQHFDDSGLEEGPLEESDISPVSTSPEFDTKHASGSQEFISFNNEVTNVLENEIGGKSEVYQNDYKSSEQSCESQHVDLITKHTELSEVELSSLQASNASVTGINEIPNVNHTNESNQSLCTEKNYAEDVHCTVHEKISSQQANKIHTETGVFEENLTLNTSFPQCLEPITSTPHQSRERITEECVVATLEERLNVLEIFDPANCGKAENLSPVSNNLLQTSAEDAKTSISSLLPSGVGQLLEQLADEENKTLPTALSDSLCEELQSGITPIDLVTIPDEVPEAEGVTEDSDSEKDGGWSYIQGGKTDLSKQERPRPSVSVEMTSNINSKKLINNKPAKKDPTKLVNEIKTLQLKPNTLIRKKVLPEKIDNKDKHLKDKASSVTLKTTKSPKATIIPDKPKKPTSAPSKLIPQVAKSTETNSRPKSSTMPSGRIPASRTNSAVTQKAAVTNTAMPKQQKHLDQRVTSTAQITTIAGSTTRTTATIRKSAPRPPASTVQRITAKTSTLQIGHSVPVAQPKVHIQATKPAASTRLATKSNQDVKQVKETTNKQISSQPSSVPKTKMPLVNKKSLPQNHLPSRAQVSSKPTTSKQLTGPPKVSLAKTQKPLLTLKSSVKNKVSTVSAAKSTTSKAAKGMQKPIENPDDLRHQPSEQEKGTKEELTKENVADVHVVEECVLKQESIQSHAMEAELENEAIQE